MPTRPSERGQIGTPLRVYQDDIRNTSVIELMLLMVFVFLIVLAAAGAVVKRSPEHPVDTAEVIRTKLVKAEEALQQQKKRGEELEARLKELEAGRSRLGELDRLLKEREAAARVLGEPHLAPSRNLADVARIRVEALSREIEALKREIARLTGKDARASGGLDAPPCWRDEAGQPVYLYTITLAEGRFRVERAWPDARQAEVESTPALAAMAGRSLPPGDFGPLARPIYDLAVNQRCRHFVSIRYGAGATVEAIEEIGRYFYHKLDRRPGGPPPGPAPAPRQAPAPVPPPPAPSAGGLY